MALMHVHADIVAKYRWQYTVNSCIKAAGYVQLFNFLMWLLFKCGFYSRVALYAMFSVCKTRESVWHDVTRTVKAKLDSVDAKKVLQNVNKHLGMQKR